MKKKLPRFLMIFCLIFTLLACTPTKWYSKGTDGIMKNEILGVFTPQQIDSICVADTLPLNLSDWIPLLSKDYESGDRVYQYLFIKRHSDKETVYVITRFNDDKNYRIQKRSVK